MYSSNAFTFLITQIVYIHTVGPYLEVNKVFKKLDNCV